MSKKPERMMVILMIPSESRFGKQTVLVMKPLTMIMDLISLLEEVILRFIVIKVVRNRNILFGINEGRGAFVSSLF